MSVGVLDKKNSGCWPCIAHHVRVKDEVCETLSFSLNSVRVGEMGHFCPALLARLA